MASLGLARRTVLPLGSGPWPSPCGVVDTHRMLGCSTWSSLASLHRVRSSSLHRLTQEQKDDALRQRQGYSSTRKHELTLA